MNTYHDKGDGHPDYNKFRWRMRHSNGDEFDTDGYYTQTEVEAWECYSPVRPITETKK
jgi:hypothetical protein